MKEKLFKKKYKESLKGCGFIDIENQKCGKENHYCIKCRTNILHYKRILRRMKFKTLGKDELITLIYNNLKIQQDLKKELCDIIEEIRKK